VQEQLALLIELSELDDRLQDLTLERETLPSEIDMLDERKKAIHDGVVERETRLETSAKERKRLERDLEDLTAKLRDLESKRIEIKTNEEYAALSLEIENARKQISDTEDTILRELEDADQAATGLDEARRDAGEKTGELDERVAELRSELRRLDDAIVIKRDERLRLTKRVDPALLRKYEMILSSKGDTALASVTDGTCSGCRIKLPPQTLIEVKRSDRLMECQSCGRILHWKPEGGLG